MSVTIQVGVDGTVKNEAALVLTEAGLNLSTAEERSLPFDLSIRLGRFRRRAMHPNEETIAVIRAAEPGELIRIGHPSNLIAELDAD